MFNENHMTLPFESSQWDESNKLQFVVIGSLDAYIYQEMSKFSRRNNSVNITSINMELLPFDSSQ